MIQEDGSASKWRRKAVGGARLEGTGRSPVLCVITLNMELLRRQYEAQIEGRGPGWVEKTCVGGIKGHSKP